MSHATRRLSDHVDVVCFSHLRWNFVFQRPQHLLSRCARARRVYYVEESVALSERGAAPRLQTQVSDGVTVVVPMMPSDLEPSQHSAIARQLLDAFMQQERIVDYVLWYYTPMALPFTAHLSPRAIVYDCMDELSAFKGAPTGLRELEARLMRSASLVLTGGQSLYEAKRDQHHNIHPCPSSVDVDHFRRARYPMDVQSDQLTIKAPRMGFFGVIDERMDLALIDGVARARPEWNLVMLGPVVKIDSASLPRRSNIHYLGGKQYDELPQYISGWDVALLPFARNEATRFISPTKTPEYMAAGKPIVSTSIRDVVRPYGERGLVRIADDVSTFVCACEAAMTEDTAVRLKQFDAYLAHVSWDRTWSRIESLIDDAVLAPPRIERPVLITPATGARWPAAAGAERSGSVA